MPKVWGTLAILVVSTVATACSSADAKNDYVASVSEIRATAIDTYNQTVNATPTNPNAQARQLTAAEATFADIVAELESLDVPEEARAGHRDLVAGFTDLRRLFGDAVTSVENAEGTAESFEAVEAIGAEGDTIAQSIDQAVDRIRDDLDAG
jgi:hypothetical protein